MYNPITQLDLKGVFILGINIFLLVSTATILLQCHQVN